MANNIITSNNTNIMSLTILFRGTGTCFLAVIQFKRQFTIFLENAVYQHNDKKHGTAFHVLTNSTSMHCDQMSVKLETVANNMRRSALVAV